MSGTRPRRAAVAAALAALLACPSPPSAGGGPPAPARPPRVVLESGGKAHAVAVELAADPASRERGLMFRQKLEEGRGMLFVFEEEGEHPFWMKDTLISLDIVFIDGRGRITGIAPRAQPLSLEMRMAGRSRWVLEVAGGWAAARGVRPGHRVRIEGLAGPER